MIGDLAPMFRMPVSFGPAPGPRNIPAVHRHRQYDKKSLTLTLTALTDAEALQRLLPEGFVVEQPARLEVCLLVLTQIGWLAGRGYNIVMIRIPALWSGSDEVSGHFVPVVWENLADPILTGRDELGWPKIYADIPDPVEADGAWRAHAAWDGFTFLEMRAEGLASASAHLPARPMMFHKYVPCTGQWGEAEVDYFTVSSADGPPPRVASRLEGRGRFEFRRASWEDMPTQYTIVNALADLPLDDFGPATLVASSGGGDGSGQRRLR